MYYHSTGLHYERPKFKPEGQTHQVVTMSAPEESAPALASVPAVEQPEQEVQVEQKEESGQEVKAESDEPKPVTRTL